MALSQGCTDKKERKKNLLRISDHAVAVLTVKAQSFGANMLN